MHGNQNYEKLDQCDRPVSARVGNWYCPEFERTREEAIEWALKRPNVREIYLYSEATQGRGAVGPLRY
jgi:hypothetical protein